MIIVKKRTRIFAMAIAFFVAVSMMPMMPSVGEVYGASGNRETESNNNMSSADSISVNTTYYGNLQTDSDDDYYRFKTTTAGTVTLSFNHTDLKSSSSYWDVDLLNADGDWVYGEYIAGNRTSTTFTTIGLPAGTYYVKIVPYSSSLHSNTDYNFNVGFAASSVWETEGNDGMSSSDPISVNTTYYGNLQTDSDDDYFWFKTTSAGTVTLKFNHVNLNTPSSYWDVDLLDADGDWVYGEYIAGNRTSTTFTTIGLPAGTYYVKIVPYSSSLHSDTDYNFNVGFAASSVWETEGNDGMSSSDPISVGKRYYGNLMYSSDDDYYWFKLSKKTKLKLNFKHGYIKSSSNYWAMSLYDVNGYSVDTYYIKGNKKSTSFNLGYVPKGTYYLAVKDYEKYSNMNYSLAVTKNNKPYNTKITSIKAGKKKATLQWKKSSDAKGYEIYRATKKNGKYKKIKTIKNKKTVKYTNKKLKKNKKYYYKIRAYRVVNGKKVYSSYSSAKAVKVK